MTNMENTSPVSSSTSAAIRWDLCRDGADNGHAHNICICGYHIMDDGDYRKFTMHVNHSWSFFWKPENAVLPNFYLHWLSNNNDYLKQVFSFPDIRQWLTLRKNNPYLPSSAIRGVLSSGVGCATRRRGPRRATDVTLFYRRAIKPQSARCFSRLRPPSRD